MNKSSDDKEWQKKEDIRLFELKNHIESMVRDYNVRLNRLEEARKPYIRFENTRGLLLISKDLEYCL